MDVEGGYAAATTTTTTTGWSQLIYRLQRGLRCGGRDGNWGTKTGRDACWIGMVQGRIRSMLDRGWNDEWDGTESRRQRGVCEFLVPVSKRLLASPVPVSGVCLVLLPGAAF